MANIQMTPEKLEALRSEYKFRNVRGKYPRQKMLPEYQSIYPWVMPDVVDPYFAFCILCECRLSAKRSDLGKHEGSIKHTQNAAEKGGTLPKGAHQLNIKTKRKASVTQGEDDEEANVEHEAEEEDNGAENDVDEVKSCIKQEPIIDLIETSNVESKLDLKNGTLESNTENNMDVGKNDEVDDDDDEEEDDEEDDDDSDVSYVPPKKRRTAVVESDSQHSGTLDYVPVHVTINEVNNPSQLFSLREIASANYISAATPTQPPPSHNILQHHNKTMPSPMHYSSPIAQSTTMTSTTNQTPCKITIKKITAPLAPVIPTQVTSTATITPVPASLKITQQQTATVMATQPPILQLPPTSKQSHSTGTASLTAATSIPALPHQTAVRQTTPVVRDSFDLFFDSICATVKALPPKLATEGKIRVMQLIGELEIRAIVEGEAAGGGVAQQVVASTTK